MRQLAQRPELVGPDRVFAPGEDPRLLDGEVQLNPEQTWRGEWAASVLSERFGVPAEHFITVLVKSQPDVQRLVTIDASPSGLYMGSYNQVMKIRRKKAEVEIDGERYDAIHSTSWVAYEAMVNQIRESTSWFRDYPLPDSDAVSPKYHNAFTGELLDYRDPRTETLLTAEPIVGLNAQRGFVTHEGVPVRLPINPKRDTPETRVRIAVVQPANF